MAKANMNRVWEIAENRAAMASERNGKVRVGLNWKNGVINAGVKRYAQEFLSVAFEDESDERADRECKLAKDAEQKAQDKVVSIGQAKQKRNTGRYIELLEKAQRLGLNTGSPWKATWRDIDVGLSPEWEGELVCYVYPK